MNKYIERVYVAGPLTPRGTRPDATSPANEHLFNLRDMLRAGAQLVLNGYSPYVPGLDFQLFLVEDLTDEQMKGVSMAWLEKSDAILVLPYSEESTGVVAELARAKELGIPVFTSVSDINEFMLRNSNSV